MTEDNFWPPAEALLDLSGMVQLSDGRARCTGIAMCDAEGRPKCLFDQYEAAHFFYEFEILDEIGVPSGGLALQDADWSLIGGIVHAKNTFQSGLPAPGPIQPGTRLRYHQVVHLQVRPGDYSFDVVLASTDGASYRAYRQQAISYPLLNQVMQEHCRVVKAGMFTVRPLANGQWLHDGLANLPGDCHVMVMGSPPTEPSTVAPSAGMMEETPAVFHITHWRAGSQWIRKILRESIPDRIVEPQVGGVQFSRWPVQAGKVYPTLYVTKHQFERVALSANHCRFVIIRDLRDTLVSAYFSIKFSHAVIAPVIAIRRATLRSLSVEEGLMYLMDEWLQNSARIQASWVESGEEIIRYEDLLEDDVEILERTLLDKCRLPVSRERLRQVVQSNRFEQITGRQRGEEDVTAHRRKGMAGDWQNHFSPRVKEAFKIRYGGILIATGYEKDLNW